MNPLASGRSPDVTALQRTHRSTPLVGDIPRLLNDPLGAFMTGGRLCGDVVRFRVAPQHAYLVIHPDHVRHVLHRQRMVYVRDRRHAARLREASGRGLTASDGELWARQRTLLRPAFQDRKDVAQSEAVVRATTRMLERWEAVRQRGEMVDFTQEMLRLALEIIADALFSAEISDGAPRLVAEARAVLDQLYRGMRNPLSLKLRSSVRSGARSSRATLYAFAGRLLDERARCPAGEDLLAILARYDDRQLAQDQVVTMVLAGHDTTGTALAWAGHLIATHPAVGRRLHDEALYAESLSEQPVTRPYARRVFSEALRLYPPAWTLSRTPTVSNELGGCVIEAGATVFISPFVMHRHPGLWPDASRFEPERFAEPSGHGSAFIYMPFGAGPRMCVGKSLAETTGMLVLSLIARRFRLTPAYSSPMETQARLTLHPRGPMCMRIQPWPVEPCSAQGRVEVQRPHGS